MTPARRHRWWFPSRICSFASVSTWHPAWLPSTSDMGSPYRLRHRISPVGAFMRWVRLDHQPPVIYLIFMAFGLNRNLTPVSCIVPIIMPHAIFYVVFVYSYNSGTLRCVVDGRISCALCHTYIIICTQKYVELFDYIYGYHSVRNRKGRMSGGRFRSSINVNGKSHSEIMLISQQAFGLCSL